MKTLLFTALTAGGQAYDIQFPLHPQTRSPEAVSDMLTGLLETLSRQVEERKDVSDGDVLQALAMTLAVRALMIGANPDSIKGLMDELLDQAHRAAQTADAYNAARA
ncbi:MAG: hypothetical protein QNK18_15990 [Gammaproteobacteria bacterium]|nr:hypothetical protein [Gammaproteobacteria bacterium]